MASYKRKLSAEELERIFTTHSDWLEYGGLTGTKADFRDTALDYFSPPVIDLSHVEFDSASLKSADFHDAKLVGSSFQNADLSAANLRRADLSKSDLTSVNLINANLSETNLEGAKLTDANFRSSKAIKAKFIRSKMWRTLLNEADAMGADFSDADLDGADLRGADLRGAKFERASLQGASFVSADLSGANFEKANLIEADLSGADVDETSFKSADLTEADLLGVQNWDRVDITSAVFTLTKNIPETKSSFHYFKYIWWPLSVVCNAIALANLSYEYTALFRWAQFFKNIFASYQIFVDTWVRPLVDWIGQILHIPIPFWLPDYLVFHSLFGTSFLLAVRSQPITSSLRLLATLVHGFWHWLIWPYIVFRYIYDKKHYGNSKYSPHVRAAIKFLLFTLIVFALILFFNWQLVDRST